MVVLAGATQESGLDRKTNQPSGGVRTSETRGRNEDRSKDKPPSETHKVRPRGAPASCKAHVKVCSSLSSRPHCPASGLEHCWEGSAPLVPLQRLLLS